MTDIDPQQRTDPPVWRLGGDGTPDCIFLAGSWRLNFADRDRRRLQRELSSMDSPQQLSWNLIHVSALDGAGAWLLWRIWGQQFPADLQCSALHRRRFKQLAEAPPRPPRHRRFTIARGLDRLGEDLIAVATHITGLLTLLVGVLIDLAVWTVRWRLIPVREITAEIYHTGVSSIVLLGVTGYLIGVVMSLQVGITLANFGASDQIIGLMGLAVMRELGPMIAAIIQVGRAGSAITAGIAGMHLTEELDALQTFGNSPRMRLVTPRVLAMVITMPLLVVWTDAAEILGGATVGQLDLGVTFKMFMARLPDSIQIYNFWFGLAKGALFGLIIALVSGYFGLTARASTDSLSSQTTRSVVVGLALILIIDGLTGALLAWMGFL